MKPFRNTPILVLLLLLGAALISACTSAQAAAPDSLESDSNGPAVIPNLGIIVEGRLMPNEAVDLSFAANGEVLEVLVVEGDRVKAGDVLARLGNREALQAAIANAEVELFNARQTFDELSGNLGIARAEALKAVSLANREIRDAQYQLDNFTIPSNQNDLTAIEAVAIMKMTLDRARIDFEPYKNLSSNDSNRKRMRENLDGAQSDYNAAVRRLEYEVALTQAEARLENAMQEYESLQDGPDPDAVGAAEVRITAAEAALEAAQAGLDNLELRSTINGVVVSLDLIKGQQVLPGQAVISIADFSSWYVETDDLTEIDVVAISLGQQVSIAADALPDLPLTGTVTSISQVSEDKRGDVTYTVEILLDKADPRLRWGMTLAVSFKE
ncbi:HlyD family secretion protein [Chloroflexota bacterium]